MEENTVKGPMKNPPHPGVVLKSLYLEPLELSISDVASGLGITRKTLSLLINGHQAVSIEMAFRLAEAFNTSPQLWLNMQLNYDLRQAEKKERKIEIRHFWETQLKVN
jgi:antitoxin HigA-1